MVLRQDDAALAFAAVAVPAEDVRGVAHLSGRTMRRRIRRLVRSRGFNDTRTATRNLDLPLAIGDPHLFTTPPTA